MKQENEIIHNSCERKMNLQGQDERIIRQNVFYYYKQINRKLFSALVVIINILFFSHSGKLMMALF